MADRKKSARKVGTEAPLTPNAAARERCRFIETIVDLSPDILYIYDLVDRKNVYSNRGIETVLGYSPEDVRAMGEQFIPGLMHPDDLKGYAGETVPRYSRAKDGERIERQFRMRHRSGDWRWLDCVEVVYRRQPDGSPRQIFGVLRDITERKQAEDALRERENKLHTLFDSVNDSMLIFGLDGRFLEANDFVCRRLGYSKEEFLRMSPRDIDTPEAALNVPVNVADILRKGMHQFESEQLAKDGSRVPVEISARVIDYEGQKAILAVCRDITARKKAEDWLRQSERFVRNILDTVDEGFLVIDRDYRILTANKAYFSQVGLPSEEAIGRHCYEISHRAHQPCFAEGVECAARLVFDTGAPHTVAHQHPDARGGLVFVETRCFPITDGSGAVTSVIETINNITERHLLEEERLKTEKLASIGTLAGGIAHDFNNLLQGVFGYISMAKLTFNEREKSLAMLEQAEKALNQSVNLTTQLLTFSKGGKPVRKRMTLLPVIENASKFALSGSRSECRIESDPDLWQVDADAGQLGQVIQNIVLNADQAMPRGGSVVIAARNLPAADEARPHPLGKRDCVLISIQDSGQGIPEEHLGRVFDPYFTTKERGSGLGLATSYSIVRNHDGAIDVKSAAGKGTTFLICLPALGVVAEEPPKEAGPAGRRIGRILVMDDEEIVRNVAGELLKALGHTPAFANTGETAIEAYSSALESGQPFDVVILDLTIRGGMGGVETMRKLLEIDPNVQAVVSSGYADSAAMAHYQRQGFKACLKKPYSMRELRQTLDALLATGTETSPARSLPIS